MIVQEVRKHASLLVKNYIETNYMQGDGVHLLYKADVN